jgi:hypothetical protein
MCAAAAADDADAAADAAAAEVSPPPTENRLKAPAIAHHRLQCISQTQKAAGD